MIMLFFGINSKLALTFGCKVDHLPFIIIPIDSSILHVSIEAGAGDATTEVTRYDRGITERVVE